MGERCFVLKFSRGYVFLLPQSRYLLFSRMGINLYFKYVYARAVHLTEETGELLLLYGILICLQETVSFLTVIILLLLCLCAI